MNSRFEFGKIMALMSLIKDQAQANAALMGDVAMHLIDQDDGPSLQKITDGSMLAAAIFTIEGLIVGHRIQDDGTLLECTCGKCEPSERDYLKAGGAQRLLDLRETLYNVFTESVGFGFAKEFRETQDARIAETRKVSAERETQRASDPKLTPVKATPLAEVERSTADALLGGIFGSDPLA